MKSYRICLIIFSSLWVLVACNVKVREKTITPDQDSMIPALGSISGSFRIQGETYYAVRVFAHEIDSGKIWNIQTQEGDSNYTIPDLPAGRYWVVGWFYPTGVSGAYTSLDTVMVLGVEDAQACQDAIVTIDLHPGQHFTGADIGCWGSGFFDIAQPKGFTRLDPNRWRLTSIEGQALISGSTITLVFEHGTFFGSAGCNHYGGKYETAPGGGFKLNEIELNAMLCEKPVGVMEQEDRFIAAIASIHSYITVNSVLELIDQNGDVLLQFDLMPTFDEMKPENLMGKIWQLDSAPGLEDVDLTAFTIIFEGQEFVGTTSCRDYAGNYQAENDRLQIGFLEMTTEVNCEDSQLMAEGWYTTLLENIEQYNILDDRLELSTLKGEKIIFQMLPSEK